MELKTIILFLTVACSYVVSSSAVQSFVLKDETKAALREQELGVKTIFSKGNEIVTTINAQMDAFQQNSVMQLTGVHRAISGELDKLSQNKEYEPCITKERILINYIAIRASAAIHYIIRNSNEKAQKIRNEIIQPLQGLKLPGFMSRCVSEVKKPICTEQEAANVLVEAKNAFEESLRRLTKAGSTVVEIATNTQKRIAAKIEQARRRADNFLKDTIRRCVEI